jgi:hypothetical protein
MPTYLKQLVPTYYDTLVSWDVVEEILDIFPEEEQAEAYDVLFRALDYAVLHTVLEHLPKHHHQTFLELCVNQHHEPSLLNWLEERHDGIREVIRITIKETKIEVKNILIEERF